MDVSRALEQHIAVFGEEGSGKTVLLSSFYGATQEPQYLKNSLYNVVADDLGQGNRLHKNYLGMKNSAQVPAGTKFAGTSYSFSIKLKQGSEVGATTSRPFDALRVVWHDYPGEWFQSDVSGPEEAQRRVDTFRSLLTSDVALLLVDAQQLIEHAGAEKQYLRSLLGNFRNGLLALQDELLQEGKLVEFPRIWVLGLSKSDLLPEMDVFAFRDLVIEKAAEDVEQLREVLGELVEAKDALSVGEDFVLLSSARFDADRIEVTKRVGVDMVLPLAAMLPFERHVRWAQARLAQGKVVENLLRGAASLATVLVGTKSKFLGPVGKLLNIVGPNVVEAAELAGDKLAQVNAEALTKQDHLRATLTRFAMDLDRGEDERILFRSRR